MKRIANMIAIAIIISLTLSFGIAFSADQVVTAKVIDIKQAVTKNGNPYTRLIVEEPASLNGVAYTIQVPLMAFGGLSDIIKDVKPGDTIKCIAAVKMYQDSKSYTLRTLLK